MIRVGQIPPSTLLIVLAELAAVVLLVLILNVIGRRLITSTLSQRALGKNDERAAGLRSQLRKALLRVGFLAALAVVGVNAYLVIYRGEDLGSIARLLTARMSVESWLELGLAVGKVFILVVITSIALRFLRPALDVACRRAQLFDGIQANDESVGQFFAALKLLASRAIWLAVLAVSARLLGLDTVHEALIVALRIYLIIALGRLLWRALDAIVATVDGLGEKLAHSRELDRYYDRLKPLVPLLRRTIEYFIYLTVASLAVLQITPIASLAGWGPRLIRILSFFFLTRVVIEVVNLLVEEALTRGELEPAQKQRRLTLVPVARSFLQYGIYFGFVMVALKELGLDPTPFLAGAGIVGLAVGFGAQSLIADMVSGLFILFEEYYLVGDYIQACDARGVVESIDLRTTRVRDDEGRHHILRNGEITNIVNYSKEFTCAVVEVGVAYGSDLGHVKRVIEEVGQAIEKARRDVLEPTRVDGVEVYAESSLILRASTRVRPGCHRPVERELRRRIKEAFEQHGVEIAPTVSLESMPFPSH